MADEKKREIPDLWPDFSAFLPPPERLAEIKAATDARVSRRQRIVDKAKALIPVLKAEPGVKYICVVGAYDRDTNALRVMVVDQATIDRLKSGKETREPDADSKRYYAQRGEQWHPSYLFDEVEVFFDLLVDPKDDFVAEEEEEVFWIETLTHLASDQRPPRWERKFKVEHSPNKEYDKKEPPEKRAEQLANNWTSTLFQHSNQELEEAREEGWEPRELPTKVEIRIVREVTRISRTVRSYEVKEPGNV